MWVRSINFKSPHHEFLFSANPLYPPNAKIYISFVCYELMQKLICQYLSDFKLPPGNR